MKRWRVAGDSAIGLLDRLLLALKDLGEAFVGDKESAGHFGLCTFRREEHQGVGDALALAWISSEQ